MLCVEVLGPLRVRRGDESVYLRSGHKPRLVLAVLAAGSDLTVTVETLLSALWGEQPPPSARRNLQQYVQQLRGAVDADRLILRDGGYALVAGDGLDARRFESAAVAGNAALDRGDATAAAEHLQDALDLWRGPAYAEFLDCPQVAAEAMRLEELRLNAYEWWAEANLALDRHAVVVSGLADRLPSCPFREHMAALLMYALYRVGRTADALEVFRQTGEALREQLGVDAGTALQQLHQAILRDEAVTLAPGRAGAAARAVPRQLPRDLPDFTGRAEDLAEVAAPVMSAGRAVVISAVDGMAGVGKTALVVRAAHAIAGHYPDGQIFLDLHAHSPARAPLSAAEALGVVLRALGVPAERLPVTAEERAALWRTELANRRMLLVLDNATGVDQVQPLLPGTGESLVMITTRNRISLYGAHSVTLDVLSIPEAIALFTAIAGDRCHREPEAVETAVNLCGRLPLALRIAASRLRSRPAWTVAHLAELLRDERKRLDLLDDGDGGVAAALSLSYSQLPGPQRRFMRLLALQPGTDLTLEAAAALTDLSVHETDRMLQALLDANLLLEAVLGRYSFHDLTADFAARRVQDEEGETERRAAVHRALDYALAATRHGADLFYPGRTPIDLQLSYPPARLPALDTESVPAWFAAERPNLIAAVALAVKQGHDHHGWLLPREMAGLLRAAGHDDDSIAVLEQAVDAARRAGNGRAELISLLNLSEVIRLTGRLPDAIGLIDDALTTASKLGDDRLEAFCRRQLSSLCGRAGQFARSRMHFEESLAMLRRTGPRVEEGYAAAEYAYFLVKLGEYDDALAAARSATEIARECDNPADVANGLVIGATALSGQGRLTEALAETEIGLEIAERLDRPGIVGDARVTRIGILQRLGRQDEARIELKHLERIERTFPGRETDCDISLAAGGFHVGVGENDAAATAYNKALQIARGLGHRYEEAAALAGLACVAGAIGDAHAAADYSRQAEALRREMGVPLTTG
jgi:DNA-binding SARP family transcriptional activator